MTHDARTRDGMGRFTTGNPGGPGRKPRQAEEQYLQAMTNVCDDEAWQAICQKAVADAIGGDAKARLWLSGYLLGLPMTRVEVSDKKTKFEEMLERLGSNEPVDQATGEPVDE